jgi:Uma2 family endonuclease
MTTDPLTISPLLAWLECDPLADRIARGIVVPLSAALEQAHARGEALSLGEARIRRGYSMAYKCWFYPDASVTHAGQTPRDYVEGSPAIAIEVVSPSDTRGLATRTNFYFDCGALEMWHVYPEERHVVVHVAGAEPVTVRDFLTTPLLPGFALDVQEILSV